MVVKTWQSRALRKSILPPKLLKGDHFHPLKQQYNTGPFIAASTGLPDILFARTLSEQTFPVPVDEPFTNTSFPQRESTILKLPDKLSFRIPPTAPPHRLTLIVRLVTVARFRLFGPQQFGTPTQVHVPLPFIHWTVETNLVAPLLLSTVVFATAYRQAGLNLALLDPTCRILVPRFPITLKFFTYETQTLPPLLTKTEQWLTGWAGTETLSAPLATTPSNPLARALTTVTLSHG